MNIIQKYIAYIKDNPEGYWFKRKLFGWGWTPATKEGWLVTLVYAGIIIALALTLDDDATPKEAFLILILPFFILTAVFLRIAYKKGEKPKWSWSFPKETESTQQPTSEPTETPTQNPEQ